MYDSAMGPTAPEPFVGVAAADARGRDERRSLLIRGARRRVACLVLGLISLPVGFADSKTLRSSRRLACTSPQFRCWIRRLTGSRGVKSCADSGNRPAICAAGGGRLPRTTA